jgi:hypothetical protein
MDWMTEREPYGLCDVRAELSFLLCRASIAPECVSVVLQSNDKVYLLAFGLLLAQLLSEKVMPIMDLSDDE